jgi:hypothetical protein
MPRRLNISLTLVLALPLAAQRSRTDVGWIEVSGPRTEVVSGSALALRVRVYNDSGAVLNGVRTDWSSSDSEIAWVDDSGGVVGRRPGFAAIEARDPRSGVSGRFTVQVNPARVEITPKDLLLEVGERATLAARALDANNAVIDGVRFRWIPGLPGVVRVEDATVIGVSDGTTTLAAVIDAGPRPLGFLASAQVRVRPRSDYRLKRIAFADDTQNAVTVLSAPRTVAAGDSVTASIANLSNGGQAVLLWRNNQFRTVVQTGQTVPEADGIVARLNELSVNDSGDVVVRAGFVSEWCSDSLLLFRAANQWKPEAAAPRSCGYNLNYRALAGNADLGYISGSVMYLRRAGGTTTEITRIGATLPAVGRVASMWAPAGGAFGGVVFRAAGSGGDAFFTVSKDNQVQLLLARGERLGAYTLSQFDNLPVEAAPGEWVLRVGGGDWSGIARGKAGSWTLPIRNGDGGNVNWVHGGGTAGLFDARGNNTVLVGNTKPDNLPRLMRWDGVTLEAVAPADWNDSTFLSVGSGGGVIFVGIPTATRPEVSRFAASVKTPVAILDARTTLPGSALAGFPELSLPRNAEAGATLLRGGSGSLLKATATGLATLLTPASPAASGKHLAQIMTAVTNRNGDVLLTGQEAGMSGLYLLRSGQITTVSESNNTEKYRGPQDSPIWGFGTWSNGNFALGSGGQIAAFMNGNSWRLVYWDTPAAKPAQVFRQSDPAPGGGIYNWLGLVSIDDNGRVYFSCSLLDGRNGLFVYEKGQVQRLLVTNENGPDGLRVNGLINFVAAGARAYVRMDVLDGSINYAQVREYDGGKWRTVLSSGDAVASTSVNWFYGAEFTASARGEVALIVNTPAGNGLFVRRAGEKDRTVALGSQTGPGGEWFLSIHSASISEQGDLFFTAVVWADGRERLALYQATPQ